MTAPLPTFYFSLRSPYSWLAWHDLKMQYPKLLARLVLKPFWEPDADYQAQLRGAGEAFLYTAMSKDKHLYILSDVKRLATRRGLAVSWPVDKAPAWEVPHLAYLQAEAQGQGRQYIEAITNMRWQQGRDICNPATVEEVGAALGLDAAVLRNAHLDPRIRAQGLPALQACVQGGVFGVPFFTMGREKFWGIDRLPDFIAAVAQATAAMPPVQDSTNVPNRAMQDHAGGCG
jgi:2-hydroxychromene-2-carboxylate isomerase